MGVYDRDYYKHESAGRGPMGGVAPACQWLIALNVAVYILQILTLQSGDVVTSWLELAPDRVVGRFEIWRLLTYAFCHDPGSVWHLIGNMWFLWICGRNVEPIYGTAEFSRFYLSAAVFSGLCFTAFSLVIGRANPSVGASGAVMGVTMLCALYYPTMEILFMFVLPLQLRWLVLLYVIFDLQPVLMELGGSGRFSRVANSAHLGGLLFGYLYKRFDLRFSRLVSGLGAKKLRELVRSGSQKRGAKVRLYEPPDDRRDQADLERQVDAILEKISSQGEASLTDAERAILKEASRRYKSR